MLLDLIPVAAQRENIRNLFPELWDTIRKHAYKKTKYTCAYCGNIGAKHPVEAHEEWAFSGNKIILVNVVALCPDCHAVKHMNFLHHSQRPDAMIKFRRAIRHFAWVNHMTEKDARRYIYEQIDMHDRQADKSFIIDTKSIERYYTSIQEV